MCTVNLVGHRCCAAAVLVRTGKFMPHGAKNPHEDRKEEVRMSAAEQKQDEELDKTQDGSPHRPRYYCWSAGTGFSRDRSSIPRRLDLS